MVVWDSQPILGADVSSHRGGGTAEPSLVEFRARPRPGQEHDLGACEKFRSSGTPQTRWARKHTHTGVPVTSVHRKSEHRSSTPLLQALQLHTPAPSPGASLRPP